LGDKQGTTGAYERFARDFPESELGPELGILAAKAHLAASDHVKAGEIFLSIAEGSPAMAEAEIALVSYGECLIEQRKFERAQESFKGFLQRYPDSSLVHRARFGDAWADENLSNFTRAMKGYREVIRNAKPPIGARAQFQLGQCYVAKKEHREAIVEFLQVPASFSYPEWSSKALLQVAGCFEALGDEAKAQKYYNEVASSFPDRDEARFATQRLQRLGTN
jgi:TolA-binding protein